jgi:hypothetical protein
MQKRYIIRKYILAKSAKDALRKEKNIPADECWVDENYHKEEIIRGFEKRK